jgi:hypothetical protein
MKINKYKKFLEGVKKDEDSYLNDMLDYNVSYDNYDLYQSDDLDESDNVDNLRYIISKMLKNSDIDDFEVDGDISGFSIAVKFQRKDSFDQVIKVFSLINDISNDILPQYDSEVDSYEDKSGSSNIIFYFENRI